MKGTSIEQ